MAGFFILLVCLVLGSALQAWLGLSVPGSILGMLLLLLMLLVRGQVPDSLKRITTVLSPLLPLFIIPVSAGIITQQQLLSEHGLALVVILVISLVPGALVTAAIMSMGRKSE